MLPGSDAMTRCSPRNATGTRQRLTVLGATGSIGQSTLDVVARHPQRFEVFALTAQRA